MKLPKESVELKHGRRSERPGAGDPLSLTCPALIADHFPSLCVAVDIYCERTSTALDAEPVNAFSNAGFLIAAAAAWRLRSRHSGAKADGLIGALVFVTAVVGLGSFLFHTVATRWAEWGDVLPIVVFILLYLWLIETRFFHWPRWLAGAVALAFLVLTLGLEAGVPSAVLWGGAMYLPTLATIVGASLALHRRNRAAGRALLAAAGLLLLSFTARTLDIPMCSSFPLGTHFMWHLLNALLLYLLVRLAILHLPSRVPAAH
jgi:hypothetical protein